MAMSISDFTNSDISGDLSLDLGSFGTVSLGGGTSSGPQRVPAPIPLASSGFSMNNGNMLALVVLAVVAWVVLK